jgi:hypothetical protein
MKFYSFQNVLQGTMDKIVYTDVECALKMKHAMPKPERVTMVV